jgi:hypothetical protein
MAEYRVATNGRQGTLAGHGKAAGLQLVVDKADRHHLLTPPLNTRTSRASFRSCPHYLAWHPFAGYLLVLRPYVPDGALSERSVNVVKSLQIQGQMTNAMDAIGLNLKSNHLSSSR